jgi:predicted SprT family Zn-dependent metalloprotease
MRMNKRQQKAISALNLDLFRQDPASRPAPATLHTKIRQEAGQRPAEATLALEPVLAELPDEKELQHMFDRYNWMYFDGKLPKRRIEYSARMRSAGSYIPSEKLIRIGRKYHEIFPEELADTLKHEMIHILYLNHDANFKREAARIGATVRARTHPALSRPPRYIYVCPSCGHEYHRQKRLVMASCGDCSRGRRFDPRYKLKLKRSFKKKS